MVLHSNEAAIYLHRIQMRMDSTEQTSQTQTSLPIVVVKIQANQLQSQKCSLFQVIIHRGVVRGSRKQTSNVKNNNCIACVMVLISCAILALLAEVHGTSDLLTGSPSPVVACSPPPAPADCSASALRLHLDTGRLLLGSKESCGVWGLQGCLV